MAILSTNISEASDLTAVYNPVIYAFSATTTGAGSKAQGNIYVLSPITENETITIDSVVLTAKDSPGFNEFYTTTSTSGADIATSIAYCINENPNLNYKYEATAAGTTVTIDAIKKGASYNQTITTNSAGLVCISLAGGTDVTTADSLNNFGVYLDVYIGQTGYFQATSLGDDDKVIRLTRKYNEDNLYTFDIQGVLKNYVSFSAPSLGAKSVQTDATAIYRINYGVEYSTSSNPYVRKYEEGTINNKWCINSSFQLDESYDMNDYHSSPVTLLTKQPATKRIYRNQEEFLNVFYARKGYAGFVGIETTFTCSDGTTSSSITSVGKNVKDAVYSYPVSADYLGVSALELSTNKTVVSYSCKVVQVSYSGGSWVATNDYSQAQDYELYPASKCAPYEKRFLFLNPLGGFDSVHFQGITETSVDIDRENYKLSYNDSFNSAIGINKTYKINSKDSFTTYSGWINESKMNWLKDMLTSIQVYIIEENELKSIQINNHDWKFDNKTKLYSLRIDWNYSWDNNTITA